MPVDIGQELYEQIKAEFDKITAADGFIKAVAGRISAGTATMEDVSLYAQQLGVRLRQVLGDKIRADVLPNGQMYYNIAEKILGPILHDNYDLVNQTAADVQRILDKRNNINIKPQKAAFPDERVQAICNAAKDQEAARAAEIMGRASDTVTRSFADDYMEENAKFRSKAGFQTYIVRATDGKCCDWCSRQAGKYSYPDATPHEVFQRHDNCGCTVTYENGGMRQDVWSKRSWEASPEELAERKELEEKNKPVRFSPEEAKAKEKELLDRKSQIQTSETSGAGFVPAKSIEEAQEYAEQFRKDELMAKNFKGIDYKGISVENANAINRALTDVYNRINLDKISGIKTVSPNSALGKKAFKDGADAVFAYDPIQHGIYVNKDVLKNKKSFVEYVNRSEDAWNTVMDNIDNLSGRQRELALLYKNAGRSLVDGETVEGMFTHELGHHAQWTLLDTKTNNSVGSRMKEYAPNISGYANASKSEYLAESFSAYMKGETDLLDPEYVSFLNSKTVDIPKKSDIINRKIRFYNINEESAYDLYTEEEIERELQKSPVGRYVSESVEYDGYSIEMNYDYNATDGECGRVIGKNISINTINHSNASEIAETIIHEVAHKKFNWDNTMEDEVNCRIYEYFHTHKTISASQIKEIVDFVEEHYSDLPRGELYGY